MVGAKRLKGKARHFGGGAILPCAVLFFGGSALLRPSDAWAIQGSGGTVGGRTPAAPWENRPDLAGTFEECDQACLYKRANENLSLQVGYLIHKTSQIEGFLAIGKDEEAQRALGAFCVPGEDDHAGLEKCFNRWKVINTSKLHQARGSMIRNANSAALLNSEFSPANPKVKSKAAPGLANSIEIDKADSLAKRPNVTYVPTFEELQKLMIDESKRLGGLLTESEYQKELEAAMQEPKPEDFPKYKRIPKNPEKPVAGEDYLILEHNPDGTDAVDEKAFKAAKALYEHSKPKFIDPEEKALRDHAQVRARTQQVNASRKAALSPAQRPAGTPPPEGSDEAILNEARQPLVDMANQLIREKKIQVQVENPSWKLGTLQYAPRSQPGSGAKDKPSSGGKAAKAPATVFSSPGASADRMTPVTGGQASSGGARATEVATPARQSAKDRKPGEEGFSQVTSGYDPTTGRLSEGTGSPDDIDQYMELQ